MNIKKKPEGFRDEKIFVLPRSFLDEASNHPLIQPVYPTDVGFFPDAKYHYRDRPEGCSQNILIYCINGQGFIHMDEKKSIVKRDTLVLIPKNTPHYYGSDMKDPWTIYWIHFLGSNAEYYFNFNRNNQTTLPVSMQKLPKAKALFSDIIDCLEKGYTQDVLIYISQILANLLGTFFFMNHDNSLGLREKNSMIEESIFFMTTHLEFPLTLADLAQQANLSPTHYSYLFKKRTGFSPMDYFIRVKVQKACQQLDLTNLKVNEIAKSLGFQDPYYFSRVFRKIMQHSPSSYREIRKG
mgnify:CR=1 FL=1